MLKKLKQWWCGIRTVRMGYSHRYGAMYHHGHYWDERENTVLKDPFELEYDAVCRHCGLKKHFVTHDVFMWVVLKARQNEGKAI